MVIAKLSVLIVIKSDFFIQFAVINPLDDHHFINVAVVWHINQIYFKIIATLLA